jgi:hypothetical protein
LIELEPGESREYRLTYTVLADVESIEAFRAAL